MTATLVPFATMVLAVYVAVLALRYRRAPTLPGQAWFAVVALSGALFAGCNILTCGSWASDGLVNLAQRLQITAGTLHAGAWLLFSRDQLRLPGRHDRAVAAALGALGLVSLVPGLVIVRSVEQTTFAPLGFLYRASPPTAGGNLVVAAIMGGLLAVLIRYARAWRRGERQAGPMAASLALLLAMAISDSLVLAGAWQGPYLLDLGFMVPLAVAGWVLGEQVVSDASALEQLRRSLERQVAERGAALERSQASLVRTQKLAAVGQLAAGVAHEVNNPTAVASANLSYLEDRLTVDGRPPEDTLEVVKETRGAVRRIARIVRQLLDTSRLAAAAERPGKPFVVADACRTALATAQPRMGTARVTATLDADLFAVGDEQGFVQVLANLLVNAAQSGPEGREVAVTLETSGDAQRVRVRVRDDGAGMDALTLARIFEPFFTTKPFGVGTGLGLAVSRGLLQGMGGDLELTSAPGAGTVATATLPATLEHPDASATGRLPPVGPRRRLLLVDDDADVRGALKRALEGRYDAVLAEGVEEGLRALAGGAAFDLVICDVMMPGGGAEAFAARLDAARPDLSRHLAYLTGGATTDGARAFLARDGRPILAKPLDLGVLAGLVEARAGQGQAPPEG